MYLIVLVEVAADKRAVYMTAVGCYVGVGRDNNAARRRGKRPRVCTEVPHNICAGRFERSAVDVAEAQRAAAVVGRVNVDYDVYAAVFEQQLLKQAAVVAAAYVVCVYVNNHGVARSNAAAYYSGVRSGKGIRGIARRALHSFDKLVAAGGYAKHILVKVERLVLCGSAANGKLVSTDIQHVVVNAACNKARAVAVVGVVKLKVEAQHQLVLHTRLEIR